MVVTERFWRIKERVVEAIDETVATFNSDSGFIWTTFRRNRDGLDFSIKIYDIGREYGLLIYPDGTVISNIGKSSILYRRDPNTAKIVDRVRVGNPPKGYLFISERDYSKYGDELVEVFQPRPVIVGPGFNGMVVGAGLNA